MYNYIHALLWKAIWALQKTNMWDVANIWWLEKFSSIKR